MIATKLLSAIITSKNPEWIFCFRIVTPYAPFEASGHAVAGGGNWFSSHIITAIRSAHKSQWTSVQVKSSLFCTRFFSSMAPPPDIESSLWSFCGFDIPSQCELRILLPKHNWLKYQTMDLHSQTHVPYLQAIACRINSFPFLSVSPLTFMARIDILRHIFQ